MTLTKEVTIKELMNIFEYTELRAATIYNVYSESGKLEDLSDYIQSKLK